MSALAFLDLSIGRKHLVLEGDLVHEIEAPISELAGLLVTCGADIYLSFTVFVSGVGVSILEHLPEPGQYYGIVVQPKISVEVLGIGYCRLP